MKSNLFLSLTHWLIGTAAVCLLLDSCATKNSDSASLTAEQKTPAPIKLPVAIAEVKNIPRQIIIPGTVAALPDHSVKISPALVGKLTNIFVIPGQPVKQGQIIAKLDDKHIRDQLEQTKAAVDLAQTNIKQAQNNLTFSKDNLERQQKLFSAEVSAKKDVIAAENQLQTAQSQLSAAQSQFKSAQANYKQIETELNFTEIHSPINGIIANRYLNAGDTTDLNTPIVQIVDLATVIINATLPADTPEKVQVGQQTKITSEADPGTIFSGIVISISPVVDTQTNSIRVQIRCPNNQNKLREGQSVAVAITSGTDKAALLLPETALVPDPDNPGQSMVYVVKDGKAKRLSVTTGAKTGNQIEITKGLRNGEMVIIDGTYGLPEGTEITPEQNSQTAKEHN